MRLIQTLFFASFVLLLGCATPQVASPPVEHPATLGGEPVANGSWDAQQEADRETSERMERYRLQDDLIQNRIAFICPDADGSEKTSTLTPERCQLTMSAWHDNFKMRREWCRRVSDGKCNYHVDFLLCQVTNPPWKTSACDEEGAQFIKNYPELGDDSKAYHERRPDPGSDVYYP